MGCERLTTRVDSGKGIRPPETPRGVVREHLDSGFVDERTALDRVASLGCRLDAPEVLLGEEDGHLKFLADGRDVSLTLLNDRRLFVS